jgi:hypothetical protein
MDCQGGENLFLIVSFAFCPLEGVCDDGKSNNNSSETKSRKETTKRTRTRGMKELDGNCQNGRRLRRGDLLLGFAALLLLVVVVP